MASRRKLLTHVNTDRLVFDDALAQRIIERSAPQPNGCTYYLNGSYEGGINVVTNDGDSLLVSILRVAWHQATGQPVTEHEEVCHCSCRGTGKSAPLCINVDHLEKISVVKARRLKIRAAHRASHRQRMAPHTQHDYRSGGRA